MQWWQFALLGAGGGAIVEVLSLFRWFTVWQSARRSAAGTVWENPPRLKQYVDVPAHAGMLMLRAFLGAVSAAIFAAGGQIQGAYVAVALGFCGPALLGRLGEIPQVASVVSGEAYAPHHHADSREQRVSTPGGFPIPTDHGRTKDPETESIGEH